MASFRSSPRCGVILRVTESSPSMLRPGDYPCTLPEGHVGETHACVVRWGEIQFSTPGVLTHIDA